MTQATKKRTYRGKHPTRIAEVSTLTGRPGVVYVRTNDGHTFEATACALSGQLPKVGEDVAEWAGLRSLSVTYNKHKQTEGTMTTMQADIERHRDLANKHASLAAMCAGYASRYLGVKYYIAAVEWQEVAADHHRLYRYNADLFIAKTKTLRLSDEVAVADKRWTDALRLICPRTMKLNDFEFTAEAKGEPGSDLRKLYDARSRAVSAFLEHTSR